MPVAEQVVARNVSLVAHRHQTGETQVARGREVDRRQTERAALGGHADPPGRRHERPKGRMQRRPRISVDNPDTVRADEPHPVRMADAQ